MKKASDSLHKKLSEALESSPPPEEWFVMKPMMPFTGKILKMKVRKIIE